MSDTSSLHLGSLLLVLPLVAGFAGNAVGQTLVFSKPLPDLPASMSPDQESSSRTISPSKAGRRMWSATKFESSRTDPVLTT